MKESTMERLRAFLLSPGGQLVVTILLSVAAIVIAYIILGV